MIQEEIERRANLLGKNLPNIRRIVQYVALNPYNAEKVLKHMNLMLRNMGFDPSNLPLFGQELPKGVNQGIKFGNVIFGRETDRILFVPGASFGRHSLVSGVTGCGKSTLVKSTIPQFVAQKIYPWIFDQENEYKVLLRTMDPEDIYVFDIGTDRDNFLQPPPGVTPNEWIAKLKNLFREAFFLRDGSINLFDTIIRNLYANRGVFDGSENYPTILDVVNFLKTIEFKPGTRFFGFQESLLNRCSGIQQDLGDCQKCRTGYSLPALLKKCVIYRTIGLSDDMRNFYIYLKMMKTLAYKEKLPPAGLKTLFVIDEAHKLYNKEIAGRHDLGEPMIFSNARTFAKRGIGCIYLDQVPSELPPALFANINNHFLMRLVNGKCIWRISQATNLRQEQSEYLPIMRDRETIIQSGDFPEPLLFKVPELRFEHVDDEEVDRHMKMVLSKIEYVPAFEALHVVTKDSVPEMPGLKKQKSGDRPNIAWTETAKIIAEVGYISLGDLYAHLNQISPWLSRKAVFTMEKQGLIELCPISFGTRGNPKTYAVLKAQGADFIGLKFDDVKLAGKGSTEHIILQNLLAEVMKDAAKSVAIEHSANGKAVDIAEIKSDGAIAYEIELSPAHPHVAENALRDLEAGFEKVVIITRNQTAQNEAKDIIYKTVPWEKLSRVEFRLIREFV